MEAYVYNSDTMKVLAKVTGDDSKAIEAKFEECFDTEELSITYSPAFGFEGGLITDGDFETIDVRG